MHAQAADCAEQLGFLLGKPGAQQRQQLLQMHLMLKMPHVLPSFSPVRADVHPQPGHLHLSAVPPRERAGPALWSANLLQVRAFPTPDLLLKSAS